MSYLVNPYKVTSAGAYETTTYINDDANTDGSNHKIYANARLCNASKVATLSALVGVKMTEMKVLCQKHGSPASSTIYGRIWGADNTSMDVLETSSTTYNTDAISDSAPYTELTFDFTGDITLAVDLKIGIYASISGGTTANSIVLRAYNPRTTDNADVLFVEYNPTEKWVVATSYNLWQSAS